jgi:hypothetical protein
LSLEGVHDIKSGDGLSAGVFGVGDGVTDHVLEEASEDGAGLLVDVRADSLDTTSTSESADRGLGDSHDGAADSLLCALSSVFASFGLAVAADLCFTCHLNYLIISGGSGLNIIPIKRDILLLEDDWLLSLNL